LGAHGHRRDSVRLRHREVQSVCAHDGKCELAEIESAGINIVFAVAEKMLPDPWDYVAVIAVMLT
jgi:hypothetical protein